MEKEKVLSIQDQLYNLLDSLNLLKHEKIYLKRRMEKLEENLSYCSKELENIKQSYLYNSNL